jgi:hypothetical protein
VLSQAFTASLWLRVVSAYRLDGGRATITSMDVVAIALAIVMFAILYVLVFGIDRV